jgi:hypothetical protein
MHDSLPLTRNGDLLILDPLVAFVAWYGAKKLFGNGAHFVLGVWIISSSARMYSFQYCRSISMNQRPPDRQIRPGSP